ncbi:MAG: CHAT domain-containing protein [Chloroflexi bacterium]|nr:CHAT domain-containing protein [Chloroflexota bacterium]MCI0575676.1 CHAT domain-containing protein [Chloroflexota bacterium]
MFTGVVTAAEVRAGLPANTTLLCYFTTGVLEQEIPLLRTLPAGGPLRDHLLTPARTLLFIVTADGLTVADCPVDPNAFAAQSPRGDDRRRFWPPAVLCRLFTFLLAPAGAALSARQLVIVPHGPLHRVPFAALEDGEGRPLLRAGGPALVYAPSATLWQRGRAGAGDRPPARPCLAVGYDGDPAVSALRHTEAEASFVAHLTGGEAWVGPQPKKESLRQAGGSWRWLHLACHGRFNEQAPLESYLETGAGERLAAREVLAGWRWPAELVTLSACQTGVSGVLRGDEPMGLVRAFFYAGARAVLVSQWPVEDLATFLLMRRFYQELAGGENVWPAAALQAAQVWLRELAGAEVQSLLAELPAVSLPSFSPEAHPFAHPSAWAGFILVSTL